MLKSCSTPTCVVAIVAIVAVAAMMLRPAPAAAQQLADFVTLTPVSDGNALTDDNGYAASETNATAFKNQSLVTVGDYQFTSYYGADQSLILGRRNLVNSPGTWFLLHTGLTSTQVSDSHTVSTIGVDGDGYLHVAWGIHDDALRYTRSTTPVLNDDPFAVPGNILGVIPEQDENTTYPEFWNIPGSGDLLLSHRTGSSGNGEYQLSRWDNGANAWSAVHVRVGSPSSQTGVQPWIDNDFSSTQAPPNVNAYHNGLAYDSTGRLHTTWTWRTGGDSTTGFTDYQSNHNFMHAYSDNDGVDWYLGDGTLLQHNGQHDIDENNATPAIAIPDGSSLINQTSSAIGPDDNLYVATWFAPQAATNNHVREYMLLEYNGTNWESHQITSRAPEAGGIGANRVPEAQLGTARMSRPIVLTDEDNRVMVVYSDIQRGQNVTVAYSESAGRDDWQFLDLTTGEDMHLWEPKYDLARWQSDGVLSMLYQPSGEGLSPNPVSILEWNARAFFLTGGAPQLTVEINRTTGAVSIINADDANVDVSAYTLASAGGQLAPARWNSLQDQLDAGWAETQATANALAEANGSGTLALPIAGQQALGSPYAGSAIAFGVDGPGDVTFDFTSGGSPFAGLVEYVGESLNNLTLLVDPVTGAARLENTSPFSVSIDAYTVASPSNSLDPNGWESLEFQGAEGGTWFEANVSTGRLSELQSSGATLLDAGESYELGRLFDGGPEQDLVFQFLIAGESTSSVGVVWFTPLGLAGDYNGDATVDAADYTVWRNTLGQTVALGSGADGDRDGTITAADYDVWKANFGASAPGSGAGSATAAVPEPSAIALVGGLALLGALLCTARRREP